MNCPACNNQLTEKNINGIFVDVCENGCAGIWFDQFEMKKFDEPHEDTGEFLLNLEPKPEIAINYDNKRSCPRCEDIIMMRHFSSIKHEIEIDECGNCGGHFLDFGELHNLRKQFKTEEERSQAARKYISELFDPMLDQARKESREKLANTKEAVKIFRFICPSNYIPGKQDWGAF